MVVVKDGKRDVEIRSKAIAAIGNIGADAKSAVPALIDALKDKDMRTDAAVALGGIGPDAKAAVDAAARRGRRQEGEEGQGVQAGRQ